MNTPIVLIHGLWLTPRSWEGWKARFEQRGHEVLAPAWPYMEREVEALRRDPSVMNGLGVTEVVDHYDRIIRGLDTPPVIMGHSFGGLITELLLDRGLGAARGRHLASAGEGRAAPATRADSHRLAGASQPGE
jgi:pimeloyl-ACP methyl ester carboxylesterase